MSGTARYDGHATWYDDTFSAIAAGTDTSEETAFLRAEIGRGNGAACLDVACGTGLRGKVLGEAGYRPIGIDISTDQLRLARNRLAGLVRADARHLPVGDASVSTAVGAYFHTDVDDFGAVVREVTRCLRPGGRFVYVGLHPCFIGPFVDRTTETDDANLVFVAGYGDVGWAHRGSGGGTGLWARVGGHHKTLTDVVRAVTEARLHLVAMREFAGGGTVLARTIGIVAERP